MWLDRSLWSLPYRVYARVQDASLIGKDVSGLKFAQAFGFSDYQALYNAVERDETLNRKLLALDNDNIVCLWKAMQARSG